MLAGAQVAVMFRKQGAYTSYCVTMLWFRCLLQAVLSENICSESVVVVSWCGYEVRMAANAVERKPGI